MCATNTKESPHCVPARQDNENNLEDDFHSVSSEDEEDVTQEFKSLDTEVSPELCNSDKQDNKNVPNGEIPDIRSAEKQEGEETTSLPPADHTFTDEAPNDQHYKNDALSSDHPNIRSPQREEGEERSTCLLPQEDNKLTSDEAGGADDQYSGQEGDWTSQKWGNEEEDFATNYQPPIEAQEFETEEFPNQKFPKHYNLEEALEAKAAGNESYSSHDYNGAISMYTAAVEVCPPEEREYLATFYNNRATAHYM
eukprot:Filipodium_phascolosomae@DN7362_c0_g1_i1.p1